MRWTSASLRARAQKIVERLARGHFARGDMRHRIEPGTAQRGRGLDIAAIIVAGQKGDGDVGTRREMIAQLRHLMAARGDLDRGGRQQRGKLAGR